MNNADFQRSDEKIPTASNAQATPAAGLHSSGLNFNKGRRKIGQPIHTSNYTSKGAPAQTSTNTFGSGNNSNPSRSNAIATTAIMPLTTS